MAQQSRLEKLVEAVVTASNWNSRVDLIGLGVSRELLSRVVRGRRPITPDLAIRLEMAIGGTAGHWIRMQAAYDLAQVRLRNPAPKIPRFRRRAA